ncbi:PilW family protein [Methylobacter luteus]|uniref:PilW family protein n=1 Tax=Methylobacter luteus TaxID=415 RepID=UPI00040F2501|nr:prepilin-type N-terminal cleavage/methylation domain-containing protein [Methylobacter luteus]
MSITRKQQTGLSLIELMIGLLVGLVIIAGGLSVFVTSVRGQADNIKLSRLNQDMRAMMDIMVRDIRRAGFVTSDPAANLISLQDNPFFGATTELAIYDSTCIVYAYNRDNDSPPTVADNERLGFRLNDGGELEMRSSGTTNENCGNGVWESITESEVEIDELVFELASTTLNVSSMTTDTDGDGCYDGDDEDPATASPSCKTGTYGNNLCETGEACNTCTRDGSPDPACLDVRNVAISLTGRLRDDNTITQTITEQVRVRNDKYLPPIP